MKNTQNKTTWVVVGILAALVIVTYLLAQVQIGNHPTEVNEKTEDQSKLAMDVVTNFGSRLKSVSLLSPNVKSDMKENYGPYVTPELLEAWQADPSKAPGRQTSSPWPERIDIISITEVDDTHYQVDGEIVEMTSQEMESGGDAGRYPVQVRVENRDGKWLIAEFVLEVAV